MSTEWRVAPVPALRGYTVEWLEPGRVFLSRRNRIYQAAGPTEQPELVGEIAAPLWKRVASRVRLGQRLLRFLVYNLLPLTKDTLFITFGRQVGLLSNGRYQALDGIVRPCRVLRGGCALDASGDVFWGEYVSNPDRGSIRAYRYRPGDNGAEVVHTFDPGEVRHIHGIYRDPYTDLLWCVSGDRADESRIVRTGDSFRTFETVGEGDESWRTVSLQFTPEAVVYATDAEFQPNELCRLDRRTAARTTQAELDGPVYYSHAVGRDLFFATTAELCPSQKAPVASLWHVSDATGVSRILSFTKDLWRRRSTATLFMPGTLHFPLGPGLDRETYFSAVALEGVDDQTFRLYRSDVG